MPWGFLAPMAPHMQGIVWAWGLVWPASERRDNHLKGFKEFHLHARAQISRRQLSGLKYLVCAIFARQRTLTRVYRLLPECQGRNLALTAVLYVLYFCGYNPVCKGTPIILHGVGSPEYSLGSGPVADARSLATLEVTRGQVSRHSSAEANRIWWHLYGN